MSEAIEKRRQERGELIELTAEEVRNYICKNATATEITRFQEQCRRHRLDPLKREIYLVKYGTSPAETIVGYETYLKQANRTGLLNGWSVEIDKDCTEATITIHRKDWDKEFKWTVYADEFDKGQSTWKKMKKHMLRKVAIAQGMRLAFPEETDGLPYIKEEIDVYKHAYEASPQTKVEGATTVDRIINKVKPKSKEIEAEPVSKAPTKVPDKFITSKQQNYLFAIIKKNNISTDTLKEHLDRFYKVSSTSDILASDFDKVLKFLDNLVQKQKSVVKDKIPGEKPAAKEEVDMFSN